MNADAGQDLSMASNKVVSADSLLGLEPLLLTLGRPEWGCPSPNGLAEAAVYHSLTSLIAFITAALFL